MGYSVVRAGNRFGNLVTVSEAGRMKAGNRIWLCRCDCGNDVERSAKYLKLSAAPSCGCAQVLAKSLRKPDAKATSVSFIRDGKRVHTRTYKSWTAAIQRCHNPKNKSFEKYGAKGISVCEEWRNSFSTFVEHMGERPEGMTLDRYPDGKGNYEPGNCRWATYREQALNRDFGYRIECNGEILNLREIADRSGFPYSQVIAAFQDGRLDVSAGISIKAKKIVRALSDAQVAEIRSLRGVETTRTLAARFGLSRQYIGRIQRGIRLAGRGTSDEPCPEVHD